MNVYRAKLASDLLTTTAHPSKVPHPRLRAVPCISYLRRIASVADVNRYSFLCATDSPRDRGQPNRHIWTWTTHRPPRLIRKISSTPDAPTHGRGRRRSVAVLVHRVHTSAALTSRASRPGRDRGQGRSRRASFHRSFSLLDG